jgi:predicted heme/steroid binding protein
MKLKAAVLGIMLVTGANVAFADDQSFAAGALPLAPADYYKVISHDVGSFVDTISFSISAGALFATANILAVSNPVPGAGNPYSGDISNLSYSVWQGSNSFGTYSAGLGKSETVLSSGDYVLRITGMADGTHGGTYGLDLTQAMPAPEPETYAMLLAGLGLVGFLARRRKDKA